MTALAIVQLVRIVATAELKGTTEPCGCSSDPLGDVARVIALSQPAGGAGLLVDAGSLLYNGEDRAGAARPQAAAKAAQLADLYRRGEVGLGPDDLVRGAAQVAPPRLASNLAPQSRVPTAPSHL